MAESNYAVQFSLGGTAYTFTETPASSLCSVSDELSITKSDAYIYDLTEYSAEVQSGGDHKETTYNNLYISKSWLIKGEYTFALSIGSGGTLSTVTVPLTEGAEYSEIKSTSFTFSGYTMEITLNLSFLRLHYSLNGSVPSDNIYAAAIYFVGHRSVISGGNIQANSLSADGISLGNTNRYVYAYTIPTPVDNEISGATIYANPNNYIWGSTIGEPLLVNATQIKGMIQAGESTYAQKIGTSSSHPAIGSTTQPVYVNSSGVVTSCTGSLGEQATDIEMAYTNPSTEYRLVKPSQIKAMIQAAVGMQAVSLTGLISESPISVDTESES